MLFGGHYPRSLSAGARFRSPPGPTALLLAWSLSLLAAPAMAQEGESIPLPEGISALPVLVEFVDAEFPPDAFAADVQADVLVQITIDETGAVSETVPTSVIVYRFDENDELIEETFAPDDDPWGFVPPALAALAEFRFSPALDADGLPVAVGLVWRYGFYLTQEEVTIEEPLPDGELLDEPPVPDVVNLAGRIRERGTRLPLSGIEVFAVQGLTEYNTVTDEEGRFEFRGLAAGTWRIEALPVNYQELSSDEEIVEGERTNVSYVIERDDYGGYTFEVREDAVEREVSRQTLSVTEINRVPGNRGDAIKVIENLPGFARAPFSGGLVVIRGSAPEDSRIFVEGVWIPLIFHFGGLTATVNSDTIEEIEYLPGAFTVQYGRATGGVINVETRAPRRDGFHGYADVDIFDVGVLIEGPIAEEWSFYATARRSYIDAILPAVIPDDAGISLSVAPRYWDYQFKLQWDPSPAHSLSLLAFGSYDTLEFLIKEPPSDPALRGNVDTSTEFHRVRFEYEAEITPDVSNRLVIGGGTQALDFTLESDELFFLLDSTPWTFRDTLEWRVSDNLRLRPGLDIELTPFDIAIRAPRPNKEGEVPIGVSQSEIIETFISDTIYEPGAFLEVEWDILDTWTIVPGARLDYYRTVGEWSADLRFSTRWAFIDRWAVKAAVGTFHQAPTPDETSVEFGNPNLGLEQAIHYVLGFEYDITEYLTVDVQGFYKDLNNLVTRSNDVIERDGERVLEVYNNDGNGRIVGLEVLLRHQLANNFFGWVSYTLSSSERQDTAGGEYRLFSWDQTHNLAIVASYELPSNWAIGARFRYVTGIPLTPITGSVFDSDSDVYVRIPGETRSARIEDFHQLDLRVDKQFIFDGWILALYLDIINVYNRANPETISYSFDFSQRAVVSGLPFIPSLGIRGSF